MAKGGPPPTTTSTVELSPEQKQIQAYALPYIKDFAASTPSTYPGSTIAGFTPGQEAGQAAVTGAAPTIQNLATSGANANQFYTSGDIWNPSSNPNLQGAIDASVRPIYQNLTESALPAIRNDAISSGNFGSSRQGIAEGLATRGASQAAGDTAAKLAEAEYGTNVDAQLKAMGLLPTVQGAQTAAGQALSSVGDVRQAMDQARLNEQVQNFFANNGGLDFSKARDIMSLMWGMPGATTVNTGSVPQPNMFNQTIGGAGTGAAIGSMFGPVGTGVGAAGGALLPWLFK